jgi:hypothetical protein
MSESPEHAFLSNAILSVLQELSNSRLYIYRESERGRLDFSCDLASSWKRVISGQTTWKNSDGIDRAMRLLLSDPEADALLYIVRDTPRNRSELHESIADYKRTDLVKNLTRLRTFWIPEGFDADRSSHRYAICRKLKESISQSLLLSVVLGGLSRCDMAAFSLWCSSAGLNLAALAEMDRVGFESFSRLGQSLNVSPRTAREAVVVLSSVGFIERGSSVNGKDLRFAVSTKGKALLDICGRICGERVSESDSTSALSYICALVGINLGSLNLWNSDPEYFLPLAGRVNDKSSTMYDEISTMLAREIYGATKSNETNFSGSVSVINTNQR